MEYRVEYADGRSFELGPWVDEASLKPEQEVIDERSAQDKKKAEEPKQSQKGKKEEGGRAVKRGFFGLSRPSSKR
jgi:hypothetical protein